MGCRSRTGTVTISICLFAHANGTLGPRQPFDGSCPIAWSVVATTHLAGGTAPGATRHCGWHGIGADGDVGGLWRFQLFRYSDVYGWNLQSLDRYGRPCCCSTVVNRVTAVGGLRVGY